jgi:hypothetical protein
MPVGSGTRQRIRNIFGRDRKELQVQGTAPSESESLTRPSEPKQLLVVQWSCISLKASVYCFCYYPHLVHFDRNLCQRE